MPLLTGQQIRDIRQALGLSQSELAYQLGFTGNSRSAINWTSNIEREVGGRHLDHAKANLLIAMTKGYKPAFAGEDA